MNKKLIIIAGSSLFFVVGVLFFILLAAQPKPVNNLLSVTPTLAPEPTLVMRGELKVLSVSPESNQSSVPLESAVVIIFNRKFAKEEVRAEFVDDQFLPVNFSPTYSNNKLILQPLNALSQSTIFTVRIRDQRLNVMYEGRFLTRTVSVAPDTRPIPLITKLAADNLANYPDVYLNNELPYEGKDFGMKVEIGVDSQLNFIVTSKTLKGQTLENKVMQWLLGIGLKEEQIKELRLVFP